jgi:glycerate dehydrogenase
MSGTRGAREYRIVFLDRATISPATRLRPPAFPHLWAEHQQTRPGEIVERCAGAHIVIVNKVPMSAEHIDALPDLAMIAVSATGTDKIDLAACAQRGIVVSNVRNYALNTVPEHVFALILALRRSIPAYRRSVTQGAWHASGQFCYFDYPIADLAGARLGIIGAGAIGSAVARLAEAFGMEVQCAGRRGEAQTKAGRVPFERVLETSDVITLHCPLTPETKGLIGDREFARMERRPLLINAARGGLVDEPALIRALDRDLIAGAGFDVATEEPAPPDHPLLTLAGRPNFILTPHVAWASAQAIQALADQLIDNIEAFVAGSPVNLVGR